MDYFVCFFLVANHSTKSYAILLDFASSVENAFSKSGYSGGGSYTANKFDGFADTADRI